MQGVKNSAQRNNRVIELNGKNDDDPKNEANAWRGIEKSTKK